MTKYDFLEKLESLLEGLPRCDIDNSLEYYGEMIDEKMDEGLTEDEAVAAIGAPEEISENILRETPLAKIVKERVKPKRRLTGMEITLIILGFPIWFPLIISVLAVLVSVLVSLWAGVISLWCVPVSIAAGSIGGFVETIVFFVDGHANTGLFMLGASYLLAGLAIFSYYGCLYTTKGLVWLSKKFFLLIKKIFAGRGNKK